MITVRILVASVVMAAVARGVWALIHAVLGDSRLAQIVSVGVAIGGAILLYSRLVLTMRIPEARQIESLVMSRFRRA
jgi:uncharacterized membrane protein